MAVSHACMTVDGRWQQNSFWAPLSASAAPAQPRL